MANEVLLGCDPEVFVFDTKAQRVVSAHGMIQGTKANPLKVDFGMVQVDGLALEFGIDPAPDEATFIHNISAVISQLEDMLPAHHELLWQPIVTFDKDIIDNSPEEALELGCEPDFNSYNDGFFNPRPVLTDNMIYVRSAGGHVHIGWTSDQDKFNNDVLLECAITARLLDKYLGLPSMAWDRDKTRRLIYGKAGCFRPKSYGMEYRTLSNQWLKDQATVSFVYRQTITAIEELRTSTEYKRENWEATKFFYKAQAVKNMIDSDDKEGLYQFAAEREYDIVSKRLGLR